MIFTLHAACGCFLGNGRGHNEDNFYFDKKHLPQGNNGMRKPVSMQATTQQPIVLAVFDGMGGETRGDEASFNACKIFSEEVKRLDELVISGKEFLCSACHKANEHVSKISEENAIGTMGTTVVAFFFLHDEIYVGNVGDSKAFRIRDNQMTQISEDHTDEKIMAAIGIQKKPVLLQYIGVPDTEMVIEPYISKGEIRKGDTYVLCSDGITDVLNVKSLFEMVKAHENAEDAVNAIIAEVEKQNGSDNATIIIVKLT